MSEHLAYLFALEQFGIKFGLQNMTAIVERLGHPERAYRTVHVAGTNGKGSVTAMVDAALRAAGHRSARYTSPHLTDIRERFVIDGEMVRAGELDSAIGEVRAAIAALRADGTLEVEPTFFETTTAIAFELFRRAAVEIAVVEVGLGGRLDATNVVSPDIAAITSIALDHQQYLGRTLREIAVEKAGVIKPGVPVVVGRVDREAREAIEAVARERGAKVVHASDDVHAVTVTTSVDGVLLQPDLGRQRTQRIALRTPARDYGEIALGLQGDHQIDNAIVAVRLLELLHAPAQAIVEGLEHVAWPGRLDVRRLSGGRQIILDAAHNPAGAAALASYLQIVGAARLPLVFAAMRDKDVDGMFRSLLPVVGPLLLTRTSNARSADPDQLAERARTIAPATRITVELSPAAALDAAWRESPTIVVAGSIFLLGDVLRALHA